MKSEAPERLRRPSTCRPSERVEDRHRVEVVAPVSDLAIGDRQYRDVPVGVRGPGRNDSAFGRVLEHHDAGFDVVMDREIVASVEDNHGSVRAVELGDGLAALDVPWVAGSRDDVVEDDLFGQQVEEVPTIRNAFEALLDDAKERVERLEVVKVGDRRRQEPGSGFPGRACLWRGLGLGGRLAWLACARRAFAYFHVFLPQRSCFSAPAQATTWSRTVPTDFSCRGPGLNVVKFSKSVIIESNTCART